MKRKHKQYSRPKKPFDKLRIEEESKIKEEFGLKNKKEIWRAEAKIKSMRERAKKLISANPKEQQIFFDYLRGEGFKINTLGDILSMDKKHYLNRRLQTIVTAKGLVPTIKSARQLIVHKKVLVNGSIVSSPSYIVPVELENKIFLKESKKKVDKKESIIENKTEEMEENGI